MKGRTLDNISTLTPLTRTFCDGAHTLNALTDLLTAAYQKSLVKALGRTLDDGRFPFVVMDAPNIRLDDFRDVLASAQVSWPPTLGWMIYITLLPSPGWLTASHRPILQD